MPAIGRTPCSTRIPESSRKCEGFSEKSIAGDCPNFRGAMDVGIVSRPFRRENGTVPLPRHGLRSPHVRHAPRWSGVSPVQRAFGTGDARHAGIRLDGHPQRAGGDVVASCELGRAVLVS